MARGPKKTIEEKIAEKEELIKALTIRLEKEDKELKALQSEQKQKEVEALHDFIKNSNLTIDEATVILQKFLSANRATA